jgi:hypothetical protein
MRREPTVGEHGRSSRTGLYGVSLKAFGAASCLQYCEMEGTAYARDQEESSVAGPGDATL